MIHIKATASYLGNKKTLFVAGGISGCALWQNEYANLLYDTDLVLFDPRRVNFPIDNPNAAQEQIEWEFHHLRRADAISFWFCKETLCPIVLYELGAWSMTDKTIFVGCHPEYQRLQDVVLQTRLSRPQVQVVYSLAGLANQVIDWTKEITC